MHSLFRFALEFGFSKPPCGTPADDPSQPPGWWFVWVDKIHYLHFGIILFAIAGSVSIIVSLLTPPIPEESLYRLTFWSRHSSKVRVDLEQDAEYNEGQTETRTEGDKAKDAAEFLYEPSDQKKYALSSNKPSHIH